MPAGFQCETYRIEASSPGDWANDTKIKIHYRLRGVSGDPELDIEIIAPDEPVEYLVGIPLPPAKNTHQTLLNSADTLAETINQRSQLAVLTPHGSRSPTLTLPAVSPTALDWELTLKGGQDSDLDQQPGKVEYLHAVTRLGDEDEVALVAVPGLYDDIKDQTDQTEILLALVEQAEDLRDRLVLIDIPSDDEDAVKSDLAIRNVAETLSWLRELRVSAGEKSTRSTRAAAVYHPRLSVLDPLGGARRPLRNVPPSGHVAGVISRLDRERGAHHTPANAPVFETVDVTQQFGPQEQAGFNAAGINLLRCFAGNGIQVWG